MSPVYATKLFKKKQKEENQNKKMKTKSNNSNSNGINKQIHQMVRT